MKKIVLTFSAAVLVSACASKPVHEEEGPAVTGQTSGIDLASIDPKTSVSDNLDRHFNGAWQDNVQIPPDHASISPETALHDATIGQIKILVEGSANTPGNPQGSEAQKIGDLYASFMDRGRIESLGLKPLKDELARVSRLKSKTELPALLTHFDAIGVSLPFSLHAAPGLNDSGRMVAALEEGGFDLPGAGYYSLDQPEIKAIREQYAAHISRMLALTGEKNADRQAADIVQLETGLAASADITAASELPASVTLADLSTLVPGFDWVAYFRASGVNGKLDMINLSRPTYFAAVGKVVAAQSLPAWQSYLKWQLVHAYAPYLSSSFSDDTLMFYGKTFRGIEQPQPRDIGATELVSSLLGDAVGKLYIATNFQDAQKDHATAVTGNIKEAMRQSLTSASWLSPDARQHSLDKLAKLQLKVGYTEFWKDYTSVNIVRDDLVGNIMRAKRFEYLRIVAKIGQARDHDEWPFAPQTTYVVYERASNELVIPAAVLQAPYFDASAEDSANYGRLGVLIAHELSHGFDDAGSHYDADGKQGDLWSDADRAAFSANTRALVAQYGVYELIPGSHIDGERTLAENIADVAGLTLAYKANKIAHPTGGRIDDLTVDQRFYAGWVQLMRQKSQPEEVQRILIGSNVVPQTWRAYIPVAQQAPYYTSFDIKPASKPYLPVNQRIQLW